MRLPEEIRQALARRAVAQRAAASRWIGKRFGNASFEALGLPGGDIVDTGLKHLGKGIESPQSLAVSLAAPRMRREGVPVGDALPDADQRLYALLSRTEGDLAHARYLAWHRADEFLCRRLPLSAPAAIRCVTSMPRATRSSVTCRPSRNACA